MFFIRNFKVPVQTPTVIMNSGQNNLQITHAANQPVY